MLFLQRTGLPISFLIIFRLTKQKKIISSFILNQNKISIKNKLSSPYSNFRVGSSLLTDNGKFFQGANIENVSYGLTVCAERTCIFNCVLTGETKIKAITATTDMEEILTPCGACRQVMAEFGNPIVFTISKSRKFKIYLLSELLLDGCRIDHLKKK